jgi:ABC-type transporter Mla MlaB component
MPAADANLVVCDAGGVIAADVGTVDALAHLALALRRLDCRLEIRHASPELRELLALAGLARVLPCADGSGPEMER